VLPGVDCVILKRSRRIWVSDERAPSVAGQILHRASLRSGRRTPRGHRVVLNAAEGDLRRQGRSGGDPQIIKTPSDGSALQTGSGRFAASCACLSRPSRNKPKTAAREPLWREARFDGVLSIHAFHYLMNALHRGCRRTSSHFQFQAVEVLSQGHRARRAITVRSVKAFGSLSSSVASAARRSLTNPSLVVVSPYKTISPQRSQCPLW
jgi:hypothetical protein